MNNSKTNIHFLGPPGSGKGTQSEILANKLGFIHLSIGDLLRKRAMLPDEFANHLKNVLDTGELVPYGIIERLYEEELTKFNHARGFVFDGFLRNQEHLEALSQLWQKFNLDEPILIVLEISDQESVKRLIKRRICPKCHKIAFAQKNEKVICPKCGTTMIQRSDDQKEAILNRLKIYHRETKPLITIFESKNRTMIVDGSPSIDKIAERIIKKIDQIGLINF